MTSLDPRDMMPEPEHDLWLLSQQVTAVVTSLRAMSTADLAAIAALGSRLYAAAAAECRRRMGDGGDIHAA
jgi:hypothetical protein